ncbi:DNA repair and recombination protein RAD54B [Halyomorpha halys]|uniref:DNA repair and recombination protein RAD54B n=1 Tax=Halyomorpha halys TaxID=286706 RepID=UPI0006D4FAEF|nr:DNA repair and recombination protein RAD54B-like [Halyomorpha halys]
MRRSKAPSELAKFKQPLKTLANVTPLKYKSNGEDRESLFSINEKNCQSSEPQESRIPVSPQTSETKLESLQIFNVVYGKISKKKHKTWDGDGTLEVGLSHLTLKDDSGKSLGQVRRSKNVTVEEGSRIFVGNKEVEVIDAVISSKAPLKRPIDKDENIEFNASKKIKNLEGSKSQISKSFTGILKTSKLHSSYDPLIMPTPSDEHQWEFNSDYLPVTEVAVEARLCRILRPHQREGITFLYRCISGIRNLQHTGAILADEMGLGKTLQCISLIWTLLNQGPYGGKPLLKRVLVIVPSSLVQNWNNEFIRWIGSHRLKVFSIDQRNRPEDYIKNSNIPVLIISYEMFVRSYELLKDLKYDLIICDEGHRLKNSNIKAAVLLNTLPCRKRILLTGTPVQNDLQEFYSLIDLVNPGVLGTLKDFQKNYVKAILASKEPKASDDVIKEGKEKSEELSRSTSSFILRRTQAIIDKFLPVKNEYVVFCSASVLKQIYNAVTELWYNQCVENFDSSEPSTGLHLQIIHALKKICNHPILLNGASQETAINGDFSNTILEIISQHKFSEDLSKDSGKLNLLINLLKFLSPKNERIVIVSCFTQTLDLLEEVCNKFKYKYERFDGSTPLSARTCIVNKFNDKNSDVFVLLLSNKAGGLGLNLIGGSRLVLYDSDWNPAIDLQAMARIWREGQRKQVFIYRFLTSGTIEEKIFQRQLSKAGLNESIVDTASESNVKLSFDELKNLFSSISSDGCITHTSLNCDCIGDGSIPQSEVEDSTCREAELLVENNSVKCSLRMNQLFQWEHHAKPISEHLLLETGLGEVGDSVNFVFKNKSS